MTRCLTPMISLITGTGVYLEASLYQTSETPTLNRSVLLGSVMDGQNRKTTIILPVQHFCSVCSYRVSAL